MKNIFRLSLVVFLLFSLLPQAAMAHSYPSKVGAKLGGGLANVVTGFVEIPKTMMVTGKKEGATYGMTAGFFSGIIHMLGRTLTGAADIATFFVPTTPVATPHYIWHDFDKETTYETWHIR